MKPQPQDDLPLEPFLADDHDCEFTPYEYDEEESWHYLRRCPRCQTVWYSLHCRCEGPRLCGRWRCAE